MLELLVAVSQAQDLGGRKMTEPPFQRKMLRRGDSLVDWRQVFHVRAQAVHASIDFEMNRKAAQRLDFCRGCFQQFNVAEGPERRRQFMFDDLVFLSTP